MSEWWEWPTMDCGVVPFSSVRGGGRIISIGNPILWWAVLAFVALTLLAVVFQLLLRRGQWQAPHRNQPFPILLTVLVVGYACNVVPYALIPRSKFAYHYVPALEIGCLIGAVLADSAMQATKERRVLRVLVVLIIFAVAGAVAWGFWYWSPWTYGFPLSMSQHRERLWNKKWGRNHLS